MPSPCPKTQSDLDRLIGGDRSAPAEQGLMEAQVIARLLLEEGERDAAGEHAVFRQDGEIHQNIAQLRIGPEQFRNLHGGASAIAAIVIEKLDDRDISVFDPSRMRRGN